MGRRADEHADTMASGLSGPAPSAAPSGELLAGRYQLLEHLGSGGMGAVYKAHDRELDELVAIKTLKREVIDAPGALDRFRRELKLARRVTHRAVARAFDLGEHQGEKFLTMELIDGRSLAAALRERGALPPEEAVRIAMQIAEGLGAAHAAGVVHRDLKPDNVLLDGQRVVITDFGVARALAGDDVRATSAGHMIGTPAYMAPEQVDGGEIDARTDLYALGTLLFETLSGELPFVGDTPIAMAAARMLRPPRNLTEVAPGAPAALVAIVHRALARAPSGRFESADAMKSALAAVSFGSVPPPSERPPRLAPIERRIAVVPFRAGVADDAWIAEGLGEDLVDALSLVRGVRVRARPGPMREGEDLAAYGQRLDVEAIVEGSVRRDGDSVRAMLRLVSTSDGFHLWAQRFDASIGGLLRVSDDAARAIADALAGAEISAPRRPMASPEAVELYLRSKHTIGMSIIPRIEQMERALVLAPDDPTILAGYAWLAASWSFAPGGPNLGERALACAQRALAIAPNLAEGHVALGHVLHNDDDDAGAMRAVLRARTLAPGSAEAEDLLGRMLCERGLLHEALAHLARALWIDPSKNFARVDALRADALLGHHDEVLRGLEELRSAAPFHYVGASARFSMWNRDYPPAPDSAPEGFHPRLRFFWEICREARKSGRISEARSSEMKALVQGAPAVSRGRRFFAQILAEVSCCCGEIEQGMEAVEAAVAAGLRDVSWMQYCPVIAPLRTRPGWDDAVATVRARGLPAVELYLSEAISLPAAL